MHPSSILNMKKAIELIDLGHNLTRFSNAYGNSRNGIVTTAASIPQKTIVDIYDASLQHYEDDIRILAWALSDFNYNQKPR